MAMYRTVSMSFWTDPKVIDDFTPEDKYFYLYLFTNPHTNLAGCYEISMKQIADETGYSRETIEKLITRFKDVHEVIDYDSGTKEVLLINWHKYNWTSSEKYRKPLLKQIESVKSPVFMDYLKLIYYENVTDDIRYQYHTDTTNTNTNTNNTNTNTKEIIDIKKQEIILLWINYKKNAGWMTSQEIDMVKEVIFNKIDKYGAEAVEMCIKQSIANGYKGIVWDYIEKPKQRQKYKGRDYSDSEFKSIEEQLLQKGG